MRPTMSDVAAAASVSKSTVSRALSGDSRVKYETRVRIMRIAQELGYTPSFSATALARGRTWMIGVATPGTPRGFSDPFYLEFLGGLGDGAIRAGYNLLIAAPSPDEEAPGGSALMEAAAAAATETGARAAADKEASAAGFAGRSRGMDLRGIIAQGAVDAVALTEPAENDPRLA
ncbi:MAG: LacI family DNA-binding transcriptional regulator, partial [Limnochordales bacterium]